MASVLAPQSRHDPRIPADVPNDLIWRLPVDRYHQMVKAGLLDQDDPIELLEGFLVYKMSKNPPHSVCTELTREALSRILPAGWHVMTQDPITTDTSEPEPDVSVIRGSVRDYMLTIRAPKTRP